MLQNLNPFPKRLISKRAIWQTTAVATGWEGNVKVMFQNFSTDTAFLLQGRFHIVGNNDAIA